MNRYFRLIAGALGVSFFGSLPLGTLNVSVSELAVAHQNGGALQFGIAAIAVEVLLVRVALAAVAALGRLRRYFIIFRVIAIVALLVVATFSLQAAFHRQMFQGAVAPLIYLHPFAAGLFLSLLNPLHLPFWMGWTAVFRSRGLLQGDPIEYNLYIVGIGLGTALAFVLYGLVGQYLQGHLGSRQPLINAVVGLTLLGTALIQAYRLIFLPAHAAAR